MDFLSLSLFSCWKKEGLWEYRIDNSHGGYGFRHIHIRRIKKRKGEFSWNETGTRHDKHKFPVHEDMISQAKEIASQKLNMPISAFQIITISDSTCIEPPFDSDDDIFCIDVYEKEHELIALNSNDYLVIIVLRYKK
ncbi:hypothetical protein OPFLODJI_01673 [Aeromonas hydrophila]|uniref:DUF6367 family protein n=1 Tax=Aeromonas hydrophila TaxID=644 RepID=UPI00366C3D18